MALVGHHVIGSSTLLVPKYLRACASAPEGPLFEEFRRIKDDVATEMLVSNPTDWWISGTYSELTMESLVEEWQAYEKLVRLVTSFSQCDCLLTILFRERLISFEIWRKPHFTTFFLSRTQ